MIKAVQMAWTFKPDDRPSAKEIADFIEQELVAVNGGSSDAPWRVEARPIPPDFDFGDDNPRGASSQFIGYTDNYRRYSDDWKKLSNPFGGRRNMLECPKGSVWF